MRDVGKRPAVHKGRGTGDGLHQIGPHRIEKQRRHRADSADIGRGDRGAAFVAADANARQPRLKVGDAIGKAQDRHDFRGDGDVEAGLARRGIAGAYSHDNLSQRPVVHVHHPSPQNVAAVQRQAGGGGQAIVQGIVDQRCQQIVRRGDGVEIAGEVQVDAIHRQHLRLAAAGGTALAAEHRAQRRFAQRDHRLAADMVERVAQPDGGGSLALAGGRWVDRGHKDQLAGGQPNSVDQLGNAMAIGIDLARRQPDLRGNVGNRLRFCGAGNVDVAGHAVPESLCRLVFNATLIEIQPHAGARVRRKARAARCRFC